jgi:hypothetical protein
MTYSLLSTSNLLAGSNSIAVANILSATPNAYLNATEVSTAINIVINDSQNISSLLDRTSSSFSTIYINPTQTRYYNVCGFGQDTDGVGDAYLALGDTNLPYGTNTFGCLFYYLNSAPAAQNEPELTLMVFGG